jgi:VIT1/CCC1 family predicted Fe2+/Mn2+ transporter
MAVSSGGARDDPRRESHYPHHAHREVSGGWLRPSVFGAMDGLVSNFALISGVAGGQAEPKTVALAGLAGLAAGAFSMAVGEYTSVASQAELAQAEIAVEREELRRRPQAELRELAELYISRGVDPDLAYQVAEQLSKDPEQALKIHSQEELGVDPHSLPSPRVAAVSSFISFAFGAMVPLLPYLLGAGSLWPALVLALLGLFGTGALVSRVTARGWLYSGMRQLLLGAAAAGLTYLFGSAVGAGLS